MHVKSLQVCPTLSDPKNMLLYPHDSTGKNAGVGCHFLLQRIFPTQDGGLVTYVSSIDSQVLYH